MHTQIKAGLKGMAVPYDQEIFGVMIQSQINSILQLIRQKILKLQSALKILQFLKKILPHTIHLVLQQRLLFNGNLYREVPFPISTHNPTIQTWMAL